MGNYHVSFQELGEVLQWALKHIPRDVIRGNRLLYPQMEERYSPHELEGLLPGRRDARTAVQVPTKPHILIIRVLLLWKFRRHILPIISFFFTFFLCRLGGIFSANTDRRLPSN